MEQDLILLVVTRTAATAEQIALQLAGTSRYRVQQIGTVNDALSYLVQHQPAALLLDLTGSGGQSPDTLRSLCETGLALPVVALVAAGDDAHGLEAVRAGAQDYVRAGDPPASLDLALRKAALRVQAAETGNEHKTRVLERIIREWLDDELADHRRTQEALRISEQRFRQLADSMPQLVWTALPNGTVDYYNRRASEFSGLREADNEHWEWSPVLHPDDVERTQAAWQHAVATGETYEIEHRAQRSDGSFRWHLSRGVPVRNEHGEIVRWYGTATDIHDVKEAQQALFESEQQLRIGINVARFAIFECALPVRRISFGPGAQQLRPGLSELSLSDLLRSVHPDDYEHLIASMERAIDPAGDGYFSGEFRVMEPGGSVRWVMSQSQTLFDGYGNERRAVRVIGAIRDITDRKHHEEQIRQLNAELEQRVVARTAQLLAANQEIESFSYSVSHDLRTPLRAIDGFSQVLLEDYEAALDEEGKYLLRRIRSASQRMGELIDDLLKLSRLVRSEIRHETINLSDLACEIVSDLNEIMPRENLEIVIEEGLIAEADPRLLRVVLENLLHNAWKFTRQCDPARIEFGRTQDQGQAAYFVRDNGVGFDMAYVTKLFNAFQRLHTRSEFEGSGIGLATVKRIIHRHGGRVWAAAAVNAGATFYFTLEPAPGTGD